MVLDMKGGCNPLTIREMKIKTTSKCHLTPIKLTKLQEFNNWLLSARLWRNWHSHTVDENSSPEEEICPSLEIFHKHLCFDP
jgi:hypothetical protein